jgi:hypothetical protein
MTRAAAWAVRAAGLMVALTIVPAALTGCGASPAKLGPAGVDELTIPTPTPDPTDFSENATNPWFPLSAGTRWTYREDTIASSTPVTAEVLPGGREIAGVSTTAVRWWIGDRSSRRVAVTRWYAVDTDGNVWWFGQEVAPGSPPLDLLARDSFQAGRDGAEAGLLVPAEPRAGDGFLNAQQPGVVQRRSTVLSLEATVATTTRTFHDALVTRDLSTLEPVHTVQTYFARGVGLVAQQDTTATSTSLTLVRVRRP